MKGRLFGIWRAAARRNVLTVATRVCRFQYDSDDGL
jgi:hypothetical protein